jgi:hypothetical protein
MRAGSPFDTISHHNSFAHTGVARMHASIIYDSDELRGNMIYMGTSGGLGEDEPYIRFDKSCNGSTPMTIMER